jgi:hypothetical protein
MKVKAITTYDDLKLKRQIKKNDEFEVAEERAYELINGHFVEELKETSILYTDGPEVREIETAVNKVDVETAVKTDKRKSLKRNAKK